MFSNECNNMGGDILAPQLETIIVNVDQLENLKRPVTVSPIVLV